MGAPAELFPLVEEFLKGQGCVDSLKAFQKEAKNTLKSSTKPKTTLIDIYNAALAKSSNGALTKDEDSKAKKQEEESSSDSSSEDESSSDSSSEESSADSSSDDESSSSSSSSDDSDNDNDADSESSSDDNSSSSSSSSDSDSDSDSDDDDDDKKPTAKNSSKDSSSKDDSKDSDTSSSSSSSSDDDSSESESDSDSSSSSSSSSSDSSSDSDSDSDSSSTPKPNGNDKKNSVPTTPAIEPPAKKQKLEGTKPKTQNEPFKRVKAEDVVFVNDKLRDNTYMSKGGSESGYGYRAHLDMIVTRGKGFRAEKTKKKRGSYKGGFITNESHSFKFPDSD